MQGTVSVYVCTKEWMVINWIKKSNMGMFPSDAFSKKHRTQDPELNPKKAMVMQQKYFVKSFFESIPKKPRKKSKKMYLQLDVQSKADLYRQYKQHCLENFQSPLSTFPFFAIFKELNLDIVRAKKK